MAIAPTTRIVLISSGATAAAFIVLGLIASFFFGTSLASWVHDFGSNRESASIIAEVSAVVVLPEDQEPQVTKVINSAQLKQDDAFFALASDGDSLLVYPSGLIILYDRNKKRLLNMGYLATSTPTGEPIPDPAAGLSPL